MKREKKANVVGSLSVMTADRYFNVRVSHNANRDLVTCDPREDPMCLVFFIAVSPYPTFRVTSEPL